MSIIASAVKFLLAAGASPETVVAMVTEMEASTEKTRSPGAEASARYRANKKLRDDGDMTRHDGDDEIPPLKENPPHPLKKITPPLPSLRSGDINAREGWPSDYRQVFWLAYPRRVGKQAAMRALDTVRQQGRVGFRALMDGVARYAAAGLDQQFIQHPDRWLRNGRWDDDPAAFARAGPQPIQPRTVYEAKQLETQEILRELRESNISRASNAPSRADRGLLPDYSGSGPSHFSDRAGRIVDLVPPVGRRESG